MLHHGKVKKIEVNWKAQTEKGQAIQTAESSLKLLLHSVTIVFIQFGIYAWCQLADFENEVWVNRYYVWDKVVNLLLVLCCINPVKTLIPFWFTIGIFFAVRLLLEVSYLTEYCEAVNYFLTQFKVMFLINFLCSIIVISKAMKKPL